MIRNKEFVWFLCVGILAAAAGTAGVWLWPEYGTAICAAAAAFIILLFAAFTWRRYRQIGKLSEYLRRIGKGDDSLDIRDNVEGELSILKNEIYKVTTRLKEQADYKNREKRYLADSLSDISHQLKTPLTSMMVMTDLLKAEELPAEKREEFTETIRGQLNRIEWLVTSLLKISKLDAGSIRFEETAVSVPEVIRKAVQHLLIPMELREITFTAEGQENARFIGDLSWSAEGFANLIKNCMEHTPAGGSVRVTYEENSLYTAVAVEDTGEGICEEDLPRVFERFYKGKNASPDSVGIGLAMAKQIFMLEHGKIAVESEPGKGTRFLVKFYKRVI